MHWLAASQASQSRCSIWHPQWPLPWTQRTAHLCAPLQLGTQPLCLSMAGSGPLGLRAGAPSGRAPGSLCTLGLTVPAESTVSCSCPARKPDSWACLTASFPILLATGSHDC